MSVIDLRSAFVQVSFPYPRTEYPSNARVVLNLIWQTPRGKGLPTRKVLSCEGIGHDTSPSPVDMGYDKRIGNVQAYWTSPNAPWDSTKTLRNRAGYISFVRTRRLDSARRSKRCQCIGDPTQRRSPGSGSAIKSRRERSKNVATDP